MPEYKVVKPHIGMFMTFLFMFSTMYTLVYFWEEGSGGKTGVNSLEGSDKGPSALSGVFSVVEWILDIVSWISPFALVRGMVVWLTLGFDPHFFKILDLLFLRPMSWVVSIVTVDFALSKIPTMSGE